MGAEHLGFFAITAGTRTEPDPPMFTWNDQPVTLAVHDDVDGLRDAWLDLEARCATSAYQRFGFVGAWARHVAPSVGFQPRVVVGTTCGETVLIVPLALRGGAVPLLVPLSDSHTNLNGGLFRDGLAGGDLAGEALRLVPEAQGFESCCMRAEVARWFGGAPVRSVHDAYVARVDEGFDAFLARNSGKRKRKKHRQAGRRFDRLGGWRVERVRDEAALHATLDEAWTLMAARFRRDGIDDPFAPEAVKAFFTNAFLASLHEERPAAGLWRLVVDERISAILSGGYGGGSFAAMFTAYSAELASESPGDFLIHETCRMTAEAGCTEYDLGRGREPYKLSWTDGPVPLYDLRIGRTVQARAWLGAQDLMARAKRRVRDDERLWGVAKRVRAVVGAKG